MLTLQKDYPEAVREAAKGLEIPQNGRYLYSGNCDKCLLHLTKSFLSPSLTRGGEITCRDLFKAWAKAADRPDAFKAADSLTCRILRYETDPFIGAMVEAPRRRRIRC